MLLFGSLVINAQSDHKLIVLITRANWCPTCRANDNKILKELIPSFSTDSNIFFLFNDITNKKSKTKAKPLLESAGVYEISLKEYFTGSIALIDSQNKTILKRVSVSNSLEAIKKSITEYAQNL